MANNELKKKSNDIEQYIPFWKFYLHIKEVNLLLVFY